jgi:hypothetical protein
MSQPTPMTNLKYARAYVVIQPYTCPIAPDAALKMGTIFPYLLKTYVYSLEKAEQGESAWK